MKRGPVPPARAGLHVNGKDWLRRARYAPAPALDLLLLLVDPGGTRHEIGGKRRTRTQEADDKDDKDECRNYEVRVP